MTDVQLKEYLEALIREQDRRIDQALAASRSAVDKAEKAQERRLDLLNEFRAQASDEARKYAQREVVEPQLSKLEESVAKLYGGLAAVSAVAIGVLVKLFVS